MNLKTKEEMKTRLEQICDEVAKEDGYWDWAHIQQCNETDIYWPEVCRRYALECCQATLAKASEKAKAKKTGNSGSWHDASVDKESITDKENIVIL